MAIVVTGASGDLGNRVCESLIKQIPATELILVSRQTDKLSWAKEQGATVREADFDNPDQLKQAFQGGHVLLLISTLSIGRRVEQHGNAIAAAKAAGVPHVVYTSSIGIQPQTPSISGQEHYKTEQILQKSGLEFTILRNSWYADVLPMLILKPSLEAGEMIMSAGDGHIAPIAKQDCAEAAASVLLAAEKHQGSIYELTGPELFTMTQLAALASEKAAKPLQYKNISHEERQAMFDAMGLSRDYEEGMMSETHNAWASTEMLTYEMAINQEFFSICSHHFTLITGRPAISMAEILDHYKSHYID